ITERARFSGQPLTNIPTTRTGKQREGHVFEVEVIHAPSKCAFHSCHFSDASNLNEANMDAFATRYLRNWFALFIMCSDVSSYLVYFEKVCTIQAKIIGSRSACACYLGLSTSSD